MITKKTQSRRNELRQRGPQPRIESGPRQELQLVSRTEHQPETLFSHNDIGYTTDGYAVIDGMYELSMATTSARTTFYARDIPDKEEKYERLYILNRGRGHTWEDDSGRKSAVRTEATLLRCDAILQSCEVPEWVRRSALRQIQRRDLRGYSRYYNGADGACVAFALVLLFDTPTEAEESKVASQAANVVPNFDESTVKKMIEYTFKKWTRSNS